MPIKKFTFIKAKFFAIIVIFVVISVISSAGQMMVEKNAINHSKHSFKNSNDYENTENGSKGLKGGNVDFYTKKTDLQPPQTTDVSIEIDGLYYLRDDDPLNYADAGSLLRTVPLENEVTLCGAFILFRFDEQAAYQGNYSIFNIYYRIWQKAPEIPTEGELFELGYYTSGGHNSYLNESITINSSECVSVVDNYRLVQAIQIVNPNIAVFNGDEIYDFTIKSIGNGPRMRTFPNQYSFVILNLEDNTTLQDYDRDGDYVGDYDELFVYFTNPFDMDTDQDGATDYDEINGGLFGYEYSDPNDPGDTTVFRQLYAESGGPYIGITSEVIQFFGDAFGGFPPYTWHWNFGDGDISDEQNTTHIYNIANTYNVTLTVTDSTENSSFDKTMVIIGNLYANFIKPENALYINNKKIISSPIPLIIGYIDLEVDAIGTISEVNMVEFYIDDVLKSAISTQPYSWRWRERSFFKHTIKTIVIDSFGYSKSIEMQVWKFF